MKTGYQEYDERVQLTMTKNDFAYLMGMLGYATGSALKDEDDVVEANSILSLVNRINEGNPNFTPHAPYAETQKT